ncbi:zf-HC2 domain-containing protein [Paenibacillus qinlingensis]|uniref:Anti-sigma-W factor RsiW n=1 Tax=Paenibacillus qinlingensis TaxID=1837343 RepID=A0ABU1NWP6_9BACL|nr:zf-HC2 domain-containing protein [Paenibacillus qinlingensis]MDR6551272.1 hypothetical protein [Paenibacillus qinlingensis]
MKCQEVMMYMQRQLDGDLAPEEEDELHAHLMHCLDCAQMFERLKVLSSELSQLPKVMPPFSLVDSILPQLLELDKQKETPQLDNVVPFPTLVARAEVEGEPKRSGLNRLKEQFSWKFASGVVAAGLIIGFFAFNMQNPATQNADELMSRFTSDSKSAKDDAPRAATEMNRMQAQDPIAKNQVDDTTNGGAPNTPTTDSLAQGTDNAESSVGSGNTPTATSNAELEKPGVFTSPASGSELQGAQVSPSTTPPERLKEVDASKKVDKTDPNADVYTPPAGLSVPKSTLEPKSTESPTKKTTQEPSVDPSSTERTSGGQGMSSLAMPQVEGVLKSTTGIYEAKIEDAHVVIRNSRTLEIVFVSKHVWQEQDQIKLLEWSKDDKLFYEVTSKGTLQTFLINLNDKTEVNK